MPHQTLLEKVRPLGRSWCAKRLTRDTVRDATQQEVQALKRENVELKQLVAELSLEGYRLKKTAIPILHAAAGING